MKESLNIILKWFMIVSFIVIILLPSVAKIFNYDPLSTINEKRQAAKLSDIINKYSKSNSLTREMEAYFNDNFGLRKSIIQLHNILKMKIGVSPTSKVVIGKQEWLFYGGGSILNDYIGLVHYNDVQKEKYKTILKNRTEWLKSKGIKYLLVIAPNAQSVYPEYLPDWIVKCNTKTKLDTLLEHIVNHPEIKYVDLRKPILNAKLKSNDVLYYRTDTHWNDIGAFYGYLEIINNLPFTDKKKVNTLQINDFTITKKSNNKGDLANMVGGTIIAPEEAPYLILKKKSGYAYVKLDDFYAAKKQMYGDIKITENKNNKLLRAVIFRDSFTDGLIPYLAESFSRVVYCWFSNYSFEKEIIEKEQPDIVISILVERFLDDTIKYPGDDVATVMKK